MKALARLSAAAAALLCSFGTMAQDYPSHVVTLIVPFAAGGPSDAIALALRTRAPIFVEDTVIDNAKTVDTSSEKADADRLHKWLESLDPDDLGKYKM